MTFAPDFDHLVATAIDAVDRGERKAACAALRQAGPAAFSAIERKLDDKRRRARRMVALLLDNALDDTSAPVLLRALQDSSAVVRRHALHSLVCEDCKSEGCWTVDITGVLIKTIETDRSRRVLVRAIRYLAGRPPETRSLEPLRGIASSRTHPRLRRQAQRALESIESALARQVA